MKKQSVSTLLAALDDRWGMFPNQTTLGSYDYFSQSVRLHSVRPEHYHDLNRAPVGAVTTVQAIKKSAPLSSHEYTHWLDMNCTLYGLRILRELALSYHFNPDLNKDAWSAENKFFHAKRVADAIKQIRLPSYYSLTFPGVANRPWQYQISIGHGFDAAGKPNSDPIVFLRFADVTGQPIARQPLSIASILEANATYHEMIEILSANSTISDTNERIVEERTDAQRLIDQVYEPQLTLYSVAAHLCAEAGKFKDIFFAYKAAAIVARFVLNCPGARLSKFKAGDTFKKKFGGDLAERIRGAIRNGNVESLFFYAVSVFDWDRTSLSDPEQDLANLSRLCFEADFEKLRGEVADEARRITAEIHDTTFPDAEILARAALDNCLRLIRSNSSSYSLGDFHLPPCFLANDEVMPVIPSREENILKDLDITNRFYSLYDNESWIRKFTDACYPQHNRLT